MHIFSYELITEHMPSGWVICEKRLDGVLNIVIDDTFASEKAANHKLQTLNTSLVRRCLQKRKKNKEYR